MSSLKEFDDGRSFDPVVVRQITQSWVDNHMKSREAEFTDAITKKIFCGTWNVNAKKQDGGLHDWILPAGQEIAEVYAIGFQEIVDLNAVNVALDSSKTLQRCQFWKSQIMECLQSTGFRFVLVGERPLVGLYLAIYAKDEVVNQIKDVRTASAAVGLMGVMGNKGGVSVRMNFYDSSICVVCAHLAAHRENVTGRNADFKNIIDRTVFAAENSIATEDANVDDVVRPRRGAVRYEGVDLSIYDHDVVLWIGDLNYRFNEDLNTEEVFDKITQKDFQCLRTHDQLNQERAKGAVFHGFQEGLIEFPPTYKYQPGTDLYERRAEKKLRAPAWCDRVLWRVGDGNGPDSVRLRKYRSANLLPSDHKPVSALFDVNLRIVVAEKEKAVYQDLMNTYEYWRNPSQPVAEVSGLIIDLHDIKYEVKSESPIEIKNVGNTFLHWHFVNKLEENKIAKRWITVDKSSGLLLPGEAVQVIVTICIDRKTAQAINQGKDTLEDVVILRVENSQDYFVNVRAHYVRSCFGVLLEELVCTHGPISLTKLPASTCAEDGAVQTALDLRDEYAQISKSRPRLAIPKELWRLVDLLWNGGGPNGGALKERDLFAITDNSDEEMQSIREALDSGMEFPTNLSPHSVAAVLIDFLASLPKPLLASDNLPTIEVDESVIRTCSRKYLESLQPLNLTVFIYLLSFFREVLSYAVYNRSSVEQITSVLLACLTPSPDDSELTKDEQNLRVQRRKLLEPIITYLMVAPSL